MTNTPPEQFRLDRLATPIGEAVILTDEAGTLRALDWADREPDMAALLRRQYGAVVFQAGLAPDRVKVPLRNYFEGDLGCLATIAWRTAGTAF